MMIAHLSDPHLRGGPLGAEPAAALHLALSRVLALDPRPDCVVVTGDIAHRHDAQAYPQLRKMIEHYPLPVHLAMGNSDDRDRLFGGTSYYAVDCPDATVVVLDSADHSLGGQAGRLGPDQLAWLADTLATGRPAVLCLHHPPIEIGVPFLDGMNLRDAEDLAAVVRKNVVLILAGHVHRTVVGSFRGTTVAMAPSTYRQSTLTMRAENPMGYLAEPTSFLLHMVTPGGLITHSVPISHAGALIGAF